MRILIAEDDLVSRKVMSKFLSPYGVCDIAVNGIEAVDLYLTAVKERNYYSLICLDIMMPKLDGIKVLKTIRNMEKQYNIEEANKVKIIMTTALNDQKTVMETYDIGCEAFAWKPIDMDKFTIVLKKLNLIEDN
jgi:two-component system, chemotaxis family, chemotaxis protein CheY